MNKELLDLYSGYLLSSFGATTATGLSKLLDGRISHDAISIMLSSERQTGKEFWKIVTPLVQEISDAESVIIVDDSIEEKPCTDKMS